MITILYFANLREQLGNSGEQIECPESVATVGDLRQYLCARGAIWSSMMDDDALLMMSVNQTMAKNDTVIRDGDEIAFFPPVTGG